MSELEALAERVEQAEGPSRELDCWIENRLGLARFEPDRPAPFGEGWLDKRVEPKPYTASLDAAMTLAENSGFANLLLMIAMQSIAERFARECGTTDEYRSALARALCAAALRARARSEPTPNTGEDA